VPYFKDAEEVYRFIGGLFEELARDEEMAPQLRRTNTVLQYRFSNPQAQITVRMKEGEEDVIDFGESALEPEVILTLDADVEHRFWLGKSSPTVALARGQIKAQGPVAKVLKLVPLVKQAFPRYVRLLEGAGRGDLLEPLR